MAELNAREMTQKARIATYKDAQLMVGGLNSEVGLTALLNVVEEL